VLRLLRRRRGLRQIDVARAARVSQSFVSLIERGHLGRSSVDDIRALFGVVDARFETSVSWRGAGLDRLLDERHAALTGAEADRLRRRGWALDLEVTFNEFGERGSIDVLATRQREAAALVVEIKTELVSIEETLRRLDVKARLLPAIVAARHGWRPRHVGRLLVILDTATARRRVGANATALGAALPARSALVRQWLRQPTGGLAGLIFSSVTTPRSAR
jgi:transcriptional regulator with XRE-family HTH domain